MVVVTVIDLDSFAIVDIVIVVVIVDIDTAK